MMALIGPLKYTGSTCPSFLSTDADSAFMSCYASTIHVQYNLNGSNPDGSFTVDDSNSFFSSYKILPILKKTNIYYFFSYFIMELYVVCTH